MGSVPFSLKEDYALEAGTNDHNRPEPEKERMLSNASKRTKKRLA